MNQQPIAMRAGSEESETVPDQLSSTTNALLGLLSLGPATGYDLRQLIEGTVGNFWKESFGQIYPALRRLVDAELAEMELEPDGKRQPRKLYRLTEKGRERLVAWLDRPARVQVPRNELLLKVFFGDQQGAERTGQQVQRLLSRQHKLLMHYRAIERVLETEHKDDPRMPYWRLTVRYGLAQTEAQVRWAEDSLRELAHMNHTR